MPSLISLLTIVVLGVMVFGSNEHEDKKAFMGSSLPTGCRKPVDVIFLLDASSSIYVPDFRKHLGFVTSVIRDLRIDPSMVRFGLVTFGDQVRVEFGLRTYSSAEMAMRAVSLVRQLRGNTRADLALQKMRQMMAEDRRTGVPQIGIVLTDGQSDYPTNTRQEAEAAHSEGIVLFAVGFGEDVDIRELRAIASREEFVFLLTSVKEFEVLKGFLPKIICSNSDEQKDETKESIQPLPECESVPLDLTFLLDHSIAFFPENLQRSQRFVKDCLSLLSVSKDEAHVSVVTFGDLTRLQFNLDAYSNLTDIRLAVSRIGFHNSETDIAQAVLVLGSSERRYRKESTKVVVVVTGGCAGEPQLAALEATRLKDQLGVVMFVVGVGAGVDLRELQSLASYPSSQTIFLIDSYDGLGSITLRLMQMVCGLDAEFRSPIPGTTQHTKQPLTTKAAAIPLTRVFTITAPTGPPPPTATTTESSRVRSRAPPAQKPSRTQSSAPIVTTGRNSQSLISTSGILTKWTSPTPIHPRTPPSMHCSRLRPSDIVFALPSSLGQADSSNALQFIASLSDQLELDGEVVRMGITPRLCPPYFRDITLDQGSSYRQLKKALDLRRLTVNSDIVSQLRYLNDVNFAAEQLVGRADSVKVAVVFFDPKVEVSEEVMKEVDRLKRNWVWVWVWVWVWNWVAVGEGYDRSSGLERLTSCWNCLPHAKSYADGLNGQLSDRLATIVMEQRCLIDVELN